MAELKTKPTKGSVTAFLSSVEDPQRRKDCKQVMALMREVTGKKATLWGDSIIGFGQYHYRYASGREGDWMVTGLSPRKQNLTVYIMNGFENYQDLLDRLGPHKTAKSCLYIKKLDQIDLDVLQEVIRRSFKDMQRMYVCS